MSRYSLIGVDGNSFCIMGYITKAMKREGLSKERIKEYREKAISGDYNNLLCISQDVIEKLNEGE